MKFCNRQEDLGQVYRWDKEMRQNTLLASGTCKDTYTATETDIWSNQDKPLCKGEWHRKVTAAAPIKHCAKQVSSS